jgi:capsular exopolysaccharide synthesis family protein
MNLAAGIPLGLVLGVGLAFLLEFLDTSVRTPRDVARHTSLPLLGVVPILDDEEVAIDDIEVATRTAPNSMVAECFRQIRTNLFFASPAENQKALLVTSPGPEDGKTAVAINLAVTIAQSGRRVLLVDANFRRPALHRAFTNAKREGLSNILIGQRQLQDLASPTDLPQLDVLTAGPIPPNPVELLSSRYMRELLARARETYDQVIIDGPPVLLVSDPLVLANFLDGAIIVCRAKSNSRGAVLRTRDQLDQVRARILGVVLNAVETAPGGYYRRQYRAFYDYLSEGGEQAHQTELPAEQADQDREAGPSKDDADS